MLGGKKAKRGPFNGFGVLEFGRTGENGKFNHGMKFGKCFKIVRSDIKKITGFFKNDQLEVSVYL
jgi:hypothetical protein